MSILDEHFKEEQEKTKKCLEGLMRLLSHDTSPTRRQLAILLRQQADMIHNQAVTDSILFMSQPIVKKGGEGKD